MAAFDFPPTPAVGTLYPAVAEVGKPQYRWNGSEWTAATFDPAGYVRKSGDAMTGALSLAGDPTQALHAVPKQWIDARKQRISLAGGNATDVQVPAGASAASLTAILMPSSSADMSVLIQLSVAAGVFVNTAGSYLCQGFSHSGNVGAVSPTNNSTLFAGMLMGNYGQSVAVATHFTGILMLKRPTTTQVFSGHFNHTAYTTGTNGFQMNIFANYMNTTAAAGALNILAFRLATSGGALAPESYLTVEWL